MLVRRWAPPLDDEMRVQPATAGSSSLCQILLLYPSFLRACISHLTIAPTRTMVSTPEGPLMQCKCQHQPTEEGSDPSAAPPARRRHEDFELSSPPVFHPSPSLGGFIFVFSTASLPSLPVLRRGAMHDSGDYPRLQATAESNTSESLAA